MIFLAIIEETVWIDPKNPTHPLNNGHYRKLCKVTKFDTKNALEIFLLKHPEAEAFAAEPHSPTRSTKIDE
jgi:hypothetical protein